MEHHSGLVFGCKREGLALKKGFITEQQHLAALKSGDDVPNQIPNFPVRLDQVGITNKKIWILLPEGRLSFCCTISVDLPPNRRGIHMSRMEQAITDLNKKEFEDIVHYGIELAQIVLESQDGECANIKISGAMPMETATKISNRVSVDRVDVEADILLKKDSNRPQIRSSASVYHITACPCTQAYLQSLFQEGNKELPLLTHSQRSKTRLGVTTREPIGFDKLLDCLTKGLHVTQDLLKRPDEAEIVLQAHYQPQFAEDAVRAVVREAGILFGSKLPLETVIEVESLSYESIHIHDVMCKIKISLAEIVQLLEQEQIKEC